MGVGGRGGLGVKRTLIDGGLIVTLDPERRMIEDGAVLIEGDRILAVGPSRQIKSNYEYSDSLNAANKVILPGFIDTHVHLSEHIFRSLVPDDAEDWMPQWLLPLYASLTPEEEYYAALLAFIEMIRSGTTTFCEAGTLMHPEAVVEAMEVVGIRGILGRWTWDIPEAPSRMRQSTDEALEKISSLMDMVHGRENPLIQCWPLVLGMETASDDLMIGAKKLADAAGCGMGFMHASSIPSMENKDSIRSLKYFEDLGILDKNVKITHLVYAEDEDLELLKTYGIKVSHCPTAAMKHCKGLTSHGRFPEMERQGICVSLGADSANGSDHANMLRIIHLVAQIFKDARMDYGVFPAETVLEMSTLRGAEALLQENLLGSIEEGKSADLVIFDRDHPEWHPLLNITHNLVYAVTDRSIETVFIAGNKVLDKGRITFIDEREIYQKVDMHSKKLLQRTNINPKTKWPLV